MNDPMTPTPYSDVNTLLIMLLERVREILGEKLVGFYLYGSLSAGRFRPGVQRCRFSDRDDG